MMRVNHCGEVCAQALYEGQSLASDNPRIKQALAKAASEAMPARNKEGLPKDVCTKASALGNMEPSIWELLPEMLKCA